MTAKATVFLVGAGPGDPGLLTIKASEAIKSADAVVYDRLVSKEIIELIPTGVARFFVGKSSGCHSVPQDEISRLLVRLARRNHRIVRLKGGDPFVFGRGSEEAMELHRNGIRYEVIPGITAASACTAYAGIPLTHRGLSRGVRLVTGHLRDGEDIELDWRALADAQSTLVVYMGLANISVICTKLIEYGLPADTPAAAIQDGTTQRQIKVLAQLDTLSARVADAGLHSPVTLVVGNTVSLANQLAWFSGDTTLEPAEPKAAEAY